MKQWRKLLLVALLAWLLLFLSLLSHFLELRSSVAPRTRSVASGPSLTHTEIRRLASIQGSGQPGGKGTPTNSSLALRNQGSSWGEREAGPPGLHLEILDGDPQEPRGEGAAVRTDPAAWSSEEDGEEESRRRKRWSSAQRGTNPEEEQKVSRSRAALQNVSRSKAELQNVSRSKAALQKVSRSRAALQKVSRSKAALQKVSRSKAELQKVSRSRAVLQRLWRGNMSAGMLSPRLQKAVKVYLNSNKHHVAYKGQRRARQSGEEVLCELKRQARLRTLDGTEEPFAGLGWARLVPSRPLDQLQGSEYRTCAVVTSAGAILNSSLGKEIDSHDAVLRFNAAPTQGFQKDVGNKTTIRIINSQILARPKHQFNTSSLYRDVTLVAWDPAPYSVDLRKWYENPDYDLFTPYSERRRRQPDQPFYILHPGFIWRLWDVIQANTQENIQPNPPSSGFIGILLMMSLCREVHVYEYIPSVRQTDLCHYHERYYDAACTLGAYHPLLYEKLLVQRMNVAPPRDLRTKGKVALRGFSAVHCGS
ncbi:beta-galactoside alpha-2,6-sialyltransferase 2-like [Diretmus argenteus]